ncbi:glucose sorbosone dehydrogenase [Pseudofrankia asymbiotica]|uniref:Glucose sorbosone dehydrogenase n=1 Tax=Pseudofrankia asymbiotica TaxID=1834516 RepID=A0A1V2I1R6_9ACTN|nr:glucose sorbosone dehydrogenase [Pseudofrankia asymbiotica]
MASDLRSPWGLAFLPDGDAILSERDSGKVLLMPADDSGGKGGYGTPAEIGTLPGVYHVGESGLLGLAVSPAYATDHLVYAYYTTRADNRIIRFTLDGGDKGATPRIGEVTPILTGLAAAQFHDGGRIAFGPDGMLYAGVGDATDRTRAQNLKILNGKILRMRPDGSVPPDNPFPGSLVYSLGHRNVQGLAWDSAGRLWAAEFGQDTWDEINLIRPGANYGWPVVEGVGDTGGGQFTNPVATWPTDDASPSGVAISGDVLYVAALKGERIWTIDLRPSLVQGTASAAAPAPSAASNGAGAPASGAPKTGAPKALRLDAYGRLRTVVTAPDGTLWVTTSNTDGRGQPAKDDDRIISLR